jgi:ubiquinone/menaquinone biosynthesis C-methylase UbiE
VDARFTGVIDGVIQHSRLRPGQQVLDLGTGTGSVAIRAAPLVVPGGTVTAIDISPEMLATARKRIAGLGLSNISFREGRAEQIPALSGQFEAVLASLSLMYVIDRDAAAREIVRVPRPSGCFVAAVWGGPEAADIDFVGYRDTLRRWSEQKGKKGLKKHWAEHNQLSIDGRPTKIFSESA